MAMSALNSVVGMRPVAASHWSIGDFLNLGAALVITQLLFWAAALGMVHFSPMNHHNLDQYQVLNFQSAPTQTYGEPLQSQAFGPAPATKISLANPGVLRFTVVVKDKSQGIGVFIPRVSDNGILYVNGERLAPPQGNWGERPTRAGIRGLFFQVPSALLRDGSNQFDLLVARECCKSFVHSVYAGPLPQMAPIAASAAWFKVTFTWIIIATSALIGLIAFSLLALKKNQAFLWSTCAFSFSVCLGAYNYIYMGTLLPTEWRAWSGSILGALLGYVSFLCLVSAWTNGPRWLFRCAIITFALVACISAAFVPFQDLGQIRQTNYTILVTSMVIVVFGMIVLLYRFIQSRQTQRYWQAGLLLISCGAAAVDFANALDVRAQPISFALLSNFVLIIALGVALAQRGTQLYLEAEAANQTLEARISAKERELDQSAQAFRAQVAETAIQTERARIMRDMHDGMGGQLLTLLMQARDPDAKREELEETVEIAIADLRLLIDSLDSVGDSLDIALAMFRERLAPRLAAARVDLNWPHSVAPIARRFTPGQILSIYRILQEAIANALRHGKPKTITVVQEFDAHAIKIALSDDGIGMRGAARAGRGLTNMRRRAAELGGNLSIDQAVEGGVRILLTLPLSDGADV